MKRKLTKTLLATTLCVAMLGTTCFAAPDVAEKNDPTADLSGSISGDNKVENPIYRVTVPTTIPFYIDPFEQREAGTQIYSESLPIINKSNVPVQVGLAFTAAEKGSSGVVFETNKDADLEADASSKKLYLAVRVPSAVVESTGTPATVSTAKPGKIWTSTTVSGKKVVADAAGDANTIFTALNGGTAVSDAAELEEPNNTVAAAPSAVYFTSSAISATPANLTFALAKAATDTAYVSGDAVDKPSSSYFTGLAADEAGTSVFRLAGKVNTKAAWAADQLTVTAAYTINGLSGNNYTAATGKTVATDDASATAHALVATESAPTADATASVTKGASQVTFSANLGEGALAASAITEIRNSFPGTDVTYAISSSDWTYSNGVVTISGTSGNGANFFGSNCSFTEATDIKLTLKFDDAKTTTKEVVLTVSP